MNATMIINFFLNFVAVYIYRTYMYRLIPSTSLRNQRIMAKIAIIITRKQRMKARNSKMMMKTT